MRTSTKLGTVVIDEIVVDIDSITLRDGRLWVNGSRSGICAVVGVESDVSIFAPDGSLVFHAPARGGGEVKEVHGRLTVKVPLELGFVSRT